MYNLRLKKSNSNILIIDRKSKSFEFLMSTLPISCLLHLLLKQENVGLAIHLIKKDPHVASFRTSFSLLSNVSLFFLLNILEVRHLHSCSTLRVYITDMHACSDRRPRHSWRQDPARTYSESKRQTFQKIIEYVQLIWEWYPIQCVYIGLHAVHAGFSVRLRNDIYKLPVSLPYSSIITAY